MTETEEQLQLLKQELELFKQKLELLKKENKELKQSRSSGSTTSGRKRPAPAVGWEVIIYGLKSIADKETALSKLENMKSPEEFLRYDFDAKSRFVELAGLTGWEDAITDQIRKVCVFYVGIE